MLHADLEGWDAVWVEAQEGGDVWIHAADSHCRRAETDTPL